MWFPEDDAHIVTRLKHWSEWNVCGLFKTSHQSLMIFGFACKMAQVMYLLHQSLKKTCSFVGNIVIFFFFMDYFLWYTATMFCQCILVGERWIWVTSASFISSNPCMHGLMAILNLNCFCRVNYVDFGHVLTQCGLDPKQVKFMPNHVRNWQFVVIWNKWFHKWLQMVQWLYWKLTSLCVGTIRGQQCHCGFGSGSCSQIDRWIADTKLVLHLTTLCMNNMSPRYHL